MLFAHCLNSSLKGKLTSLLDNRTVAVSLDLKNLESFGEPEHISDIFLEDVTVCMVHYL